MTEKGGIPNMSKASKVVVWVLRIFFVGVMALATRNSDWSTTGQIIYNLLNASVVLAGGILIFWIFPSKFVAMWSEIKNMRTKVQSIAATELSAINQLIKMCEEDQQRAERLGATHLQAEFAQHIEGLKEAREKFMRIAQ